MTVIHQFVHSFVDRDAASSHARHLRDVIKEMGIESEVFASEWRGQLSKATSFTEYSGPADAILLYQFATASPIADFLSSRNERVWVNYHNVTPAEIIRPWEPTIALELEVARQQLADIATKVECGIGVSDYNTQELISVGYKNTAVAPVLFDPAEFEHGLDAKLDTKLQQAKEKGGKDWLFVGRVAPHKCLHDVVKAFALYKRLYDADARLHMVGGMWSHRYWVVLHQYIEALELTKSVNVTNSVTNGELGAYYKNADLFVYLSEHEGFGVPVLEAFHNNIPVIAYDAAAVGEVTGNGGILLDDKSAATVAAAANRVLSDLALSEALVKAGQARLQEFSFENSRAKWRKLIEELVAG